MMKKLLMTLLFSSFAFSFDLKPIKLDENSYYIEGKKEYFSKENKGDIANSAFIITDNSVIVIDTGSSVSYALKLKEAINKITKKPIKFVINTHHHPDHFLGNYAFKESFIYASEFTKNEIKKHGELYVSNIANLIGKAGYSTKAKVPNKILEEGTLSFDKYHLEIFHLSGHTQSDIVIFDKNSKILYASDLIFNKRALATPHANIKAWITSLKKLKKLDFDILVPGHGKAQKGKKVIDENIRYLKFLDTTLTNAVSEGLEIFEILENEVPDEFKSYSIFEEEFERTLINQYPKYEKNLL